MFFSLRVAFAEIDITFCPNILKMNGSFISRLERVALLPHRRDICSANMSRSIVSTSIIVTAVGPQPLVFILETCCLTSFELFSPAEHWGVCKTYRPLSKLDLFFEDFRTKYFNLAIFRLASSDLKAHFRTSSSSSSSLSLKALTGIALGSGNFLFQPNNFARTFNKVQEGISRTKQK